MLLEASPENEWPLIYTLQIGRVFTAVCSLEMRVYAMLIMQADSENFHSTDKQLKKSSLGQLVQRLNEHGVQGRDLSYLREINRLRNKFIHGLFFEYPATGEPSVSQDSIDWLVSSLERYQRHFQFAEENLTSIVERAGMVEVVDLGTEGKILYPVDFFNKLNN
ncbi:hypothetical protein [Cognatishimia sp.]|uniref:hypothetical protein n=1 Tax=Cognatishimia sp. TaxID=2211648 RepID=UPI003511E1FA|nr:hypothetical protein [Cognatishimia sp.]